jgi:hypothetical protein
MTNPSMNSTVAEQLNLKSENSLQIDYSPSNTPVKVVSELVTEIKNDSFLSKQTKIKDDIQKRIKEYMNI